MKTHPAYIVEDSTDYQLFLGFFLRRYLPDYPVEFFEGAQQLLSRLSALDRSSEASPGIILLDLEMAGVNGYELLKLLKEADGAENQWWKDIHVVFNSATVDEQIIRECLNAGASAFFRKPTDIENLKALCDYLVQHKQAFVPK